MNEMQKQTKNIIMTHKWLSFYKNKFKSALIYQLIFPTLNRISEWIALFAFKIYMYVFMRLRWYEMMLMNEVLQMLSKIIMINKRKIVVKSIVSINRYYVLRLHNQFTDTLEMNLFSLPKCTEHYLRTTQIKSR